MDDQDLIELSDAPLDVSSAIATVSLPQAGGIDVFIGATRQEQHATFGELRALEYSAYPEMALAEMRKLAASARQQWPISRIAMLHRTGRCGIGEPTVVIAVSCPHRAETFAACRFLIDQLKATVPIWKREVFRRGEQWVTLP